MKRLRFRLFLFVTWVYSVVGISLGGLLYTIWPQYYFDWYPSIPIFYYVLEIVLLLVLEKANRKRPDAGVAPYMITRVIKLLFTVLFIWWYMSVIGVNLKSFGLTLMLFYFIFMFMGTYIFYLYEKRRMKKNER